jgi:hypothetical protein
MTAREFVVRHFECLWGVCVCAYIEEEERFLEAALLGMTALLGNMLLGMAALLEQYVARVMASFGTRFSK